MIYRLFQAGQDVLGPAQRLARGLGGVLGQLAVPHPAFHGVRQARAALEILGHAAIAQARPEFGIRAVLSGNRMVGIEEEVVAATPFGSLLRFRREDGNPLPRLLLVAPMSGHFATLLRGTVEVLLQDHDVYVTDWHNARDIPLSAGRFGLDEHIAHIIHFLSVLGPGTHLAAVCQPVVAALAAVALMAEAGSRAVPRSLTLMAGPIDTRQRPTRVNALAKSKPIDWFERSLIGSVPWRHRGAGRRVYPGAVQLAAFMSMNLGRHLTAFQEQYRNLLRGEHARAEAHRRFYDEYLAVMDLPAELYLETVGKVFQDHALPLGKLTWQGHPIRLGAICRTALLVIEGEKDDICSVGQTMAALDLCTGLPVTMKRYHLQTGVGHYGVFNGSRWARAIYPRVREVIQAHN